jgi:hypothetical protein
MHLNIFHAEHGWLNGDRNSVAEVWADAIADEFFIPCGCAMDDDFLDGAKQEGFHAVHLHALNLYGLSLLEALDL